MKERHRKTDTVFRREPLRVSDPMTVVNDVVVGKHGALGKTSRARGVLDVDDLLNIQRDVGRQTIGRVLSRFLDLLICNHASRSLLSKKNNMAKTGQFGALK